MTYEDVIPALRWRCRKLPDLATAEALVAALTVEQLRYTEIPAKIWPSVRAFRRLRSDVRLNVAVKYLRGKKGAGVDSRP
jgi:hypothetical protein